MSARLEAVWEADQADQEVLEKAHRTMSERQYTAWFSLEPLGAQTQQLLKCWDSLGTRGMSSCLCFGRKNMTSEGPKAVLGRSTSEACQPWELTPENITTESMCLESTRCCWTAVSCSTLLQSISLGTRVPL